MKMKRNEFIDKYEIDDNYEEWFLSKRMFESDLKVLGWKAIDYKPIHVFSDSLVELDVILTNPNFYTDGYVIGNSRKSEIMASGTFKFTYRDNVYIDFIKFFEVEGIEALKHLDEIVWDESMDWIIVDKKYGKLKGQFDEWDSCPTRKGVE